MLSLLTLFAPVQTFRLLSVFHRCSVRGSVLVAAACRVGCIGAQPFLSRPFLSCVSFLSWLNLVSFFCRSSLCPLVSFASLRLCVSNSSRLRLVWDRRGGGRFGFGDAVRPEKTCRE